MLLLPSPRHLELPVRQTHMILLFSHPILLNRRITRFSIILQDSHGLLEVSSYSGPFITGIIILRDYFVYFPTAILPGKFRVAVHLPKLGSSGRGDEDQAIETQAIDMV